MENGERGPRVEWTDREWLTCTADKGGEQLFDWEAPAGGLAFFWHPILAYIQLWMDAFTFDAKELSHKNSQVIKSRGHPQPAWSNPITEASVGSLPKFLVFMLVHWLLGLFVYFTHTSCSGGKNKSFEDFQCWFAGLPAAYEAHMKGFFYYNHRSALKSLPATVQTDDFSASHFLVRPCHRLSFSFNCLHQQSSGRLPFTFHFSTMTGTPHLFSSLRFFLSRFPARVPR